jgi:trehalose synthase
VIREDKKVTSSLEKYEPGFTLRPEDYEPYIGKEQVDNLKRLAEPIVGKGWANVNSTSVGGGVAEILRSAVPLARGLGIDTNWYVIRSQKSFYQVTKKIHNMLQGMDFPISLEEIFEEYLGTIEETTRNTYITSDMVVIHDPQPAAMITSGAILGNTLWRCHIDTSLPNQSLWRFLLPYINHYAGAIFTIPEFVGSGLRIPLYQISPCIDPQTEKNRHYTDSEAMDILAPLFKEYSVDPGRPILAAISRYDVHKNQSTILKSFKQLRQIKRYDPPPYLIFLGNTATDDPEGELTLERLKLKAEDDPDVKFLVNVKNNNQVVGALMHSASAFIHISTREGFGLVVSEALWQGTPVIGSRVGGITQQVIDGETGYLVDPTDADAIAAKMARLLDTPEEAVALGIKGRELVYRNFLVPELVKRYLLLLRFYTGVDRKLPEFRFNKLTYSEVLNVSRSNSSHSTSFKRCLDCIMHG